MKKVLEIGSRQHLPGPHQLWMNNSRHGFLNCLIEVRVRDWFAIDGNVCGEAQVIEAAIIIVDLLFLYTERIPDLPCRNEWPRTKGRNFCVSIFSYSFTNDARGVSVINDPDIGINPFNCSCNFKHHWYSPEGLHHAARSSCFLPDDAVFQRDLLIENALCIAPNTNLYIDELNTIQCLLQRIDWRDLYIFLFVSQIASAKPCDDIEPIFVNVVKLDL